MLGLSADEGIDGKIPILLQVGSPIEELTWRGRKIRMLRGFGEVT